MSQFKIPNGNPREKTKYYSDQLKSAWDLAAAARIKFIGYKKAMRKFHLRTSETEATRVLLSQVTVTR